MQDGFYKNYEKPVLESDEGMGGKGGGAVQEANDIRTFWIRTGIDGDGDIIWQRRKSTGMQQGPIQPYDLKSQLFQLGSTFQKQVQWSCGRIGKNFG